MYPLLPKKKTHTSAIRLVYITLPALHTPVRAIDVCISETLSCIRVYRFFYHLAYSRLPIFTQSYRAVQRTYQKYVFCGSNVPKYTSCHIWRRNIRILLTYISFIPVLVHHPSVRARALREMFETLSYLSDTRGSVHA